MKLSRKGFSLLELLVVIGIVGILMSLLFPAFHSVRTKAIKAKTRSMIENLSIAIKAYEADWHTYPNTGISLSPAGANPTSGEAQGMSRVLYFCLTTPFRAGTSVATPSGSTNANITPSKTAGPYMELRDEDYKGAGTSAYIVDPLGNPYCYTADTDYNPGTTPPVNNTSSFDVWSYGPDLTVGTADDIGNW